MTAAVAASCAAAPAAAEPCVVDALGRVATNFPPGCTPPPAAPTATAPSTSSSGGGLSGFVSEHAGLIVLVVVGLIAWTVIGGLRSEDADKEKAAVARAQGALARGRRIAEDHYAAKVQDAHAAVPVPDPATYDPHGLGIAPPPQPDPDLPPHPPMNDADLRRYAEFGAVVAWEPGSAFAAIVNRDGSDRASEAWVEACRAADAGDTDEAGAFTPIGHVVDVLAVRDGTGDVKIAVQPRDIHIGAPQLDRVLPYLARTARVATVTRFARDPATDQFVTRLSMEQAPQSAPAAQAQQQAAPDQPRVDPRWS